MCLLRPRILLSIRVGLLLRLLGPHALLRPCSGMLLVDCLLLVAWLLRRGLVVGLLHVLLVLGAGIAWLPVSRAVVRLRPLLVRHGAVRSPGACLDSVQHERNAMARASLHRLLPWFCQLPPPEGRRSLLP